MIPRGGKDAQFPGQGSSRALKLKCRGKGLLYERWQNVVRVRVHVPLKRTVSGCNSM